MTTFRLNLVVDVSLTGEHAESLVPLMAEIQAQFLGEMQDRTDGRYPFPVEQIYHGLEGTLRRALFDAVAKREQQEGRDGWVKVKGGGYNQAFRTAEKIVAATYTNVYGADPEEDAL
jgi:hypothetical protein